MATSYTAHPTLYGPTGDRLYPTPREHPGKYRHRGRVPRDIKRAIAPQDWAEIVEISMKLGARIPALRGAIRQKSEWAFAGDSWQPIYYGAHEAWGEIATDWLVNHVFPNAVLGNTRKDLIKAMQVSGMSWDWGGDDLAIFVKGKDGMPKMRIIPGTRIGNGPLVNGGTYQGWSQNVSSGTYSVGNYTLGGMGICVGGKYNGYRIYNGIIFDDQDEPVAARVLGIKREGDGWVETYADFELGFAHGTHLASEYEWHEMGRPLPRVATSILHWMNKEQIDENFLKAIQLASQRTVIHKLGEGQDAPMARGDALEQITTTDSDGNEQTIWVDTSEAGDVTYIGAREGLAGLQYENPHPNVEQFATRILRECLGDLGWPYELTDLASTGRAPTRLSCELANNSLWQKQVTGEARLNGFVKFSIGLGIDEGQIPEPPPGPLDEPYKWTFGYPKEMSVDAGNDVTASLNRLRYGLTSQRIESARWGYVQKRIDSDRDKEVMRLIDRADAVAKYANSKGHDLPFLKAVEFLYQPSPNSGSMPSVNSPEEKPSETPAPSEPFPPKESKKK